MEFTIGDRVVCIDDTNLGNSSIKGEIDLLNEDCYYRVRGFDFAGDGILLEDMFAGLYENGSEAGYRTSRFRKVEAELDYEFVEDVVKKLLERPIDLN